MLWPARRPRGDRALSERTSLAEVKPTEPVTEAARGGSASQDSAAPGLLGRAKSRVGGTRLQYQPFGDCPGGIVNLRPDPIQIKKCKIGMSLV